jgi:Predicted membrane protein
MTQDTGRSWVESTVAGLLSDVRILMRQELLLARHEFQYETGKIVKAAMLCGIALALAGIGLCVVAAACVLILFEYTGLPAWACAAIVCIILLGGAWGLRGSREGSRKVRSYGPATNRPNHFRRCERDRRVGAHAVHMNSWHVAVF